MKLGLVFGTTTGNTQDASELVASELSDLIDEPLDVEKIDMERLLEFDVLLIGIPTWDVGCLQASWDLYSPKLRKLRFDGKVVAFFGQGDQYGYPDNFQDAMGIMREIFIELGATADIGHWPIDEYEYDASKAVVDGKFVGLALDEDNQPEMTEERVKQWCAQLRTELEIRQTGT